MDGSTSIPLNYDAEHLLLPGVTGLDLPPLSVVTAQTPGIDGSWLQEVDVLQRAVFLPLEFASESSQAEFFQTLSDLCGVVAGWDQVALGSTGTFRLVANSSLGERLLDVVYSSGMEGSWGADQSGAKWQKYGLNLIAVDPYWRDRDWTVEEFTQSDPITFVTSTAGAESPWPRQIVNNFDVIGNGMRLSVGDIPAWPVVEIDGPAGGVNVIWPGTSITTNSLIASENLVLTTDPRARSARLNGQVAWSAISIGSVISSLPAGNAQIDVASASGQLPQRISVRWRKGYKAAFI